MYVLKKKKIKLITQNHKVYTVLINILKQLVLLVALIRYQFKSLKRS